MNEDKLIKVNEEQFHKIFHENWQKGKAPKELILVTMNDGTYIAVDNTENDFIFEEFKDLHEATEYLLDWDEWHRKKIKKIEDSIEPKSYIYASDEGDNTSIKIQGDLDSIMYLLGKSIMTISQDTDISVSQILRTLGNGIIAYRNHENGECEKSEN